MEIDTKEKFKEEFEKTCSFLVSRYPSKKNQEKEIVGVIINRFLHEVQLDCEKLNYLDFYKKYLVGTSFLDYTNFTKNQIIEIIQESSLSERDRKLATLYWVDLKSDEDIADILSIDKKTVRNNIPKLSVILQNTASKLYK